LRVQTNVLYYGDNLDILRRYIPDESVDLVYLDPPFNSNRAYNVIFKDESGRKSDAQLLAFEDTWHWGPDAEAQYAYLTNTARNQGRVPSTVSTIVAALRSGIGENQMMAYLVEMAVRLVELHRVLKPTGSLWLHCDPTASHYLKVLLDAIFGPERFLSEVVWKRTSAHSSAKRPGPVHDILLLYSKSATYTWSQQFEPYDPAYLETFFEMTDPDGRRWKRMDLTGAGTRNGPSGNKWHGIDVTAKGRHWLHQPVELERLDAAHLIHWPEKATGMPRLKQYADEMPGVSLQDVWTDIRPIHNLSKERLGWDTQKPLALLERIISASSNPGDVVLDPFCGCGTALVAAQRLGWRWIGIDVTYLAIAVMRARLKDSFGLADVEVIGQPTEVEGAKAMLVGTGLEGQYQFQWWALDLVGAQPLGGVQKKGADKGIDGVITFSTGPRGEMGRALVSVKSGSVTSSMVRDLKGVLDREKAEIGLFVTLEEPSGPMHLEATTAGVYHSELSGRDYPRVQVLTIRELLEEHRRPDLPLLVLPAYQQAERVETKAAEQRELFG
jgi:site-specific DNA-methyltransferase (adenine-specific)